METEQTYDVSNEPAVREILDCLQRLKDQDAPTEQLSDVLRISVQVHELIRQREEARIVALTLATAFAAAKAAAVGTGKLEDDYKLAQPETERTINDLVRKVRTDGRNKAAPYWPKGDA